MALGTLFDVAFVYVVYNAAEYIERAIESLRQFAPRDLRCCIVVVDNASNDDSLRRLQGLAGGDGNLILYAESLNHGFGAANNLAFERVSARFYALINQDAWLIADSIGPVIRSMMAAPDVYVCGLPLVFPDGSPQTYAYPYSSWHKWLLQALGARQLARAALVLPGVRVVHRWLPYGREYFRSAARSPVDLHSVYQDSGGVTLRDADWVCGAAMVLSGPFIERSGGFDPKFFLYGEDEDLCIRAHALGGRVVAAEVAPVVHVFGWGRNRWSPELAKRKFEALGYFIEKHARTRGERLMMKLLLPVHVYGLRFFARWSWK